LISVTGLTGTDWLSISSIVPAGCFTPVQQAAHQDWLADIGAFMRAVTPLHLISAGTEGFFVEDKTSMLHWYNPGL
jgi:hypothetical protein